MKTNADERKNALQVATYANSLRVALSKSGIFLKGDKTVGLLLPPDADAKTYQEAVRGLLVAKGILHYAIPGVWVSPEKGLTDASDARTVLSSSKAVIVVVENGAELPPDLVVALDRMEQIGPVKPYHLILAAKSVFDLEIDRVQAARLCTYPLPTVFAAIRKERPIEVSLAKLAAASEVQGVKLKVKWEPKIEDLAGYGKATEWALSLVEDIAAWRRGEIDWHDVDAGLLISGPPGCGKTLFASAVARSCSAHFIAASSAQWQSRGHLGDMLGAMRKTFRKAIDSAPSILFIDEFDSFGSRKNLRGDNAAYGLQVINALLEHLDGASGRQGVVVIAATNRPDDIDEALRRPGRLDRHIKVELPDLEAREQILSAHLGLELPAEEMRAIGLATSGYTGADLRLVVRDARRIARRSRRLVCGADFLSVVPPIEPLAEEERWRTCVHEAGHAIVGHALGAGEIEAIVVAKQAGHRDRSVGHVLWLRPIVRNRSLQMYRNEIAMSFGGRAAEMVALGEVYDGSGGVEGSDLHRATDVATILVGAHGIHGLGYTDISQSRNLDELRQTDPILRERVERLLAEEMARAEQIIRERHDDLTRLAEALKTAEVLPGSEVKRLLS